ncbi:MAG: ATP-NAD kinase family protein [Pseudomonadales bacterium]|nr:ATP-NAD kinase family protein [Pseudomonadales bacterium]
MADRALKVGLVVNPMAGIGGPVGLKGSDGMFEEALALGGRSQVADRVTLCLKALPVQAIEWFSVAGVMGGDYLKALDLHFHESAEPSVEATTPEDTRRVVDKLCSVGIDLLLFAGGDGTARDVADAHHTVPAVLGIPCGVKMHSGVFATSPSAATDLLNRLIDGEALSVVDAEVRDIDEASFREGVVKTRFYGELPVPDDLRYVQQTKVGGRESDELAVQEIAADVIENMTDDTLYIMGSGSTVATILDAMNLPATLLGIDVVYRGALVKADASEQELLSLLAEYPRAKIVVTAISGQGHIFGRGNQQLSAAVIQQVGPENIIIVATKSKLAALEQRPLLVDTGDAELDDSLSGMKAVLTGYEDHVLYRIA